MNILKQYGTETHDVNFYLSKIMKWKYTPLLG